MKKNALERLLLLILFLLIIGEWIAGCSDDATGTGGQQDTGTDQTTDSQSANKDSGSADFPTDTDICEPVVIDCTNRCGTVIDACSGKQYSCGGCEIGMVCDVVTNNCVLPLTTCEDLKAECGTIRNSCGVRLDCGTCPPGQECDADQNQCIKCTEPTCDDLGKECGTVWNGCGARGDVASQLDCGGCDATQVCNDTYGVCESDCTSDEPENICLLAYLERGVECGITTDGCGGVVDCGNNCPEGEACGVRGVANRCSVPERPLECAVAGWECGTRESACEGTINCGSCKDGDVCNSNHKCGPPCDPLTCETGYNGQCGQQLDDGCGGAIDCDCDPSLGCDALTPGETGTCKALKSCADYTTGEEGSACSLEATDAFPRGDGVNLACPCMGGALCIDDSSNLVTGGEVGTCCTNTNSCDGTSCTTTNSCTGQVENCCGDNQYCAADQCHDYLTCSEIDYNGSFANGQVGAPCSNQGVNLFNAGNGQMVDCPCTGDLICVDGDGPTPGTCCENTNTCDNTPLDENCQVPNSCAGGPPIDCCAFGECCEPGSPNQCVAGQTCEDYGANRGEGDPCSRSTFFEVCSANATFSDQITCGCGGGLCCLQPDPLVAGSCVAKPSCNDSTSCQVTNPCTGKVSNCCSNNQFCDTDADICVDLATCSDLGADGSIGAACSDVPSAAFPAGDGTNLSCSCNSGGTLFNNQCIGGDATTAGICSCVPDQCTCANSGQSDGCGGNVGDCACTDGQVCDVSGSTPTCCTPYACPTSGGGECGIDHESCGITVTCGCPDSYETCGGGGEANVCGCTPKNPCPGKTGFQPDGCGNLVNCGG